LKGSGEAVGEEGRKGMSPEIDVTCFGDDCQKLLNVDTLKMRDGDPFPTYQELKQAQAQASDEAAERWEKKKDEKE
jgi:hypothetical protein